MARSKPNASSALVPRQPLSAAEVEAQEALRLETRPSPVLPAVLAGSLSVLVLALIGFAALVKVDQVVTVPGRLVTRRSTQDLTTPDRGVVREVLVRSGQRVEAGQALVVLDPRVQRSEVADCAASWKQKSAVSSPPRPAYVSASAASNASSISTNGCWPIRAPRRGRQLPDPGDREGRQLETTRRELAEARQEEQTLSFESRRTQAELRAELVGTRSSSIWSRCGRRCPAP